jgi:hypothetical protein
MSFETMLRTCRRPGRLARILTSAGCLGLLLAAQGFGAGPRFYPDDPLWVDRDSVRDARGAHEREMSETVDLLLNSFVRGGGEDPGRAHNVNTVDEVPDSSWFTNRIGRRPMSMDEIVRGPDIVARLDVRDWVVVDGKGAPGFQPGFRAIDPRTNQLYQLEVDMERYPELASGAEMIGTTIYHAIGFNVVDVYLVDVDPEALRIADTATIKDARGRRRLVRADLDNVFRQAARNADGTYRMTAGRFVEGEPMGPFTHYGTRPDDPNDIHPHEHRRELRANRVFCAWINHDDSRAPNTLDLRVGPDGAQWIRHYIFDFGATLGSTPGNWWSGRAYMLEIDGIWRRLATLGFPVEPWQRSNDPRRLPAAVGRFGSESFEPDGWKPEYPNRAFDNMRADDAFWGARIVSRFSDEAIRAVVAKARYSDPAVARHIGDALIERRNRIMRAWLTGVNPIVDPLLSADGTLTFENAAVSAGVATAPVEYRLQWSRFDNATDTATGAAVEARATEPHAAAPGALLSGSEFLTVAIETSHPDYPHWILPVRAYFRRAAAGGWDTVGLERTLR